MSDTWTLVSRDKGGRFFRPVGNVPEGLGWWAVMALARKPEVNALFPKDCDVWYVPDEESQADGWPEDRDNVLVGDHKRFPIRWDAKPKYSLP